MCDSAASWQEKVDRLTLQLSNTRDRLHAEIDRLKLTNKTLHAAVSCAPMFLWATDKDGRLTLAAGKGLENLGIKPSESVGLSIFELYSSQPDILENIAQVLAGNDRTWNAREGHFMHEIRSTALRDGNGEVIGAVGVSTEITEYKKSIATLATTNQQLEARLTLQTAVWNAALADSEKKYRNLVETSQELIWSIDIQGLLTFVNSAAKRIYGYEPPEMIGRRFTDFLYPEEKHRQIEILGQLLARTSIQPETFNSAYETVHIRKDGTPVHLRVNSIVNQAENGAMLGLCGTATDISDHKRSEEALQEATDQLRAVLDAVPGLISWVSSDLRYIEVNQHLATSFKRSPESFVGQEINFLDKGSTFGQLIRNFFDSSSQQTSQEIDVEINGSIRNYLIVGQKYHQGSAAVSVGIDITDRKRAEFQKTQLITSLQESECKFRSLYEATSDAVMLIEEQNFFDCNPATLAIFGCTNKEQFYGKKPSEFSPPFQPSGQDSSSLAAQRISTAMQTGSCRFDWVHKRLDGSEFPAEVLLNAMEINGRKIIQAVVRDITDRKRDEDRIKASLAEKEVLLKEIHHRVKNNLQVISSLLKLQSRYIQDSRVSEMLKESQNRVRSMALVHEQLYQSKDLSNIDFAEYIQNLAHNLFQAYEIPTEGVNLQTNIAPCSLNIDTAVPCGLIINELVTNSLKYAFTGQVQGKIKIDFTLDENRVCVLAVSDSGIGFPQELDYRKARTLGLRLVGSLVKQIRGEIELLETAGTTFQITFSKPIGIGGKKLMSTKKILIVEDESIIAEDISDSLISLGYQITDIVYSGEEAIESVAKIRPNLVLMDVNLQGEIDGVTAAEEIRSRFQIPVVYLTAYADEKTLRRVNATKPFGYIVKPFEEKNLHTTIQIALHRHQHDCLTNLPNRALLREQLSQVLDKQKALPVMIPVVTLSLDRINRINSTLGHDIGDSVLCKVAERLTNCTEKINFVARLEAAEFAIVLEPVAEKQDAGKIAQNILDIVAQPIIVKGSELYVTASIGISLSPGDGNDGDKLLKNAYVAMYNSQQEGGNKYKFYTAKVANSSINQFTQETCLRNALKRLEFEVYYEPQIEIKTGKIIGAEALVRWNHPKRGRVSPGEFIPMAEEMGLISPLGEWVLETACMQTKAWQIEGLPPLRISVNLSARQFEQKNLTERVSQILRETNLDPKCLELELTEGLILQDETAAIQAFTVWGEMGIRLALDDFGTGYSSLSYPKRFPFDALKIDKSFIRDIADDRQNAAITVAIIQMAHCMNMTVIAEGVENQPELAFLCEHDCDEIQGHFFSQALPSAEFEALLKSDKCWELC
ncbi:MULTISPECIES: EAL domain-containing protein [unclassified Microcoleus]